MAGLTRCRCWGVLLLLLGTMAYALAEELTLTTYYPSPRGVYQELRTTGNTYLAIDGGNVGIGTASPGGNLEIFQAEPGPSLRLMRYSSGYGVSFKVRGSVENNEYVDIGAAHGTGGPEDRVAMSIGNGQAGVRVGIGTTNPRERLHVASPGYVRLPQTPGDPPPTSDCNAPESETGRLAWNRGGPTVLYFCTDAGWRVVPLQ